MLYVYKTSWPNVYHVGLRITVSSTGHWVYRQSHSYANGKRQEVNLCRLPFSQFYIYLLSRVLGQDTQLSQCSVASLPLWRWQYMCIINLPYLYWEYTLRRNVCWYPFQYTPGWREALYIMVHTDVVIGEMSAGLRKQTWKRNSPKFNLANKSTRFKGSKKYLCHNNFNALSVLLIARADIIALEF